MKLLKRIIGFIKAFFNKRKIKSEIKKIEKVLKERSENYKKSNRFKRNQWLISTGYTPKARSIRFKRAKKDNISHYSAMVKKFIKLKKENRIKIYPSRFLIVDKDRKELSRNKQGIPVYKADKIRGIYAES